MLQTVFHKLAQRKKMLSEWYLNIQTQNIELG